MDNVFENMLRQQSELFKKIKKIIPDKSYLDTLTHSNILMESVIKPSQKLIGKNAFSHLCESPLLKQFEEVSESAQLMLPKYSNAFLLSSLFLENYRDTTIIIPDILKEFELCNNNIIRSTIHLASASKIINFDIEKVPTIYESLKEYLINPILSASSHFQILKSLNYIGSTIDDEIEDCYLDTVKNNSNNAKEIIKKKNEDWLILLNGAEQSFLSKNPDKIRHTITSLRELITQIIHQNAPDSEVKQRFTDPKYYSEGKPTRRARIEFILLKKYSNSSLLEIIDKDIVAILEMFNLFNEGTHKVVSLLTDDELSFILKRTVLLVEQLI